MDDARAARLILAQGVSTAGAADEAAGRGVGLAAVVEELHRLGGDLCMESTPGRGTTFVARVPLSPGERAKEQA